MKKSEYAPELFIDPVCFMKVIPRKDFMFTYKLRSYYFCADGCRKAFEADPGRYLDATPPKRKGRRAAAPGTPGSSGAGAGGGERG